MAQEIERKFLVTGNQWKTLATGIVYRQGYLSRARQRTVRVRTIGNKGFIAVKGVTIGASRLEFEYEIPFEDCCQMLDVLAQKPLIVKKRYSIPFAGLVWEVDDFSGDNEGLVIAEVELESEDQSYVKPDWAGQEVTGDSRYYNSNLVAYPYKLWANG